MIDILAFHPVKAGMLDTLELVCNICVKHAKACTSDVLLQLVFFLKTLEQVVGLLDNCRGGKLGVYCHQARIFWCCKRGWFKERVNHWGKDHA